MCSYRTPMLLEDLSCYSSPLHPLSRQRRQPWLDDEAISLSGARQQLNAAVDSSPSSRHVVCYGDVQMDTAAGARSGSVLTQSRYCSTGECPGSPCAVCRLLQDDNVAPSADYEENVRRQQQHCCKPTRQGEPPSPATHCGTPQHNPDIVD